MIKTQKVNNIYGKVFSQQIDLYDMFDLIDSYDLMDDIFQAISKLPYYTFDGRMQNILKKNHF